MKLWIDDVRPAPEGYSWCHSVIEAKFLIEYDGIINRNFRCWHIELIDIDHDAGEYAQYGGDYIELLKWLEKTGRNYPIHIHSMNVEKRKNMEAICKRNGWTILP